MFCFFIVKHFLLIAILCNCFSRKSERLWLEHYWKILQRWQIVQNIEIKATTKTHSSKPRANLKKWLQQSTKATKRCHQRRKKCLLGWKRFPPLPSSRFLSPESSSHFSSLLKSKRVYIWFIIVWNPFKKNKLFDKNCQTKT